MRRRHLRNPELVRNYKKDYCQFCGREGNVENHHIFPRSQGGPDSKWNLISLCGGLFGCHELADKQLIPRLTLLLYKIGQLLHEESPDEAEREIQAMLDFTSDRLSEQECRRLRIRAGKEPDIAK